MKKINHAQKKWESDCDFFCALLTQAAGEKEKEALLGKCWKELEKNGTKKDAICKMEKMIGRYGWACEMSGYNAGFEQGLLEGTLLGTYGRSKAS